MTTPPSPTPPRPAPSVSQFIEAMLRASKKRTIDGIFIAHEFERPSDGQQHGFHLTAYQAPGGTLFLRKGTWRNYGCETESDFSLSVAQGRMNCRTAAGVVSLGAAIRKTGRAVEVSAFPADTMWRFSFRCQSLDEAVQVKELLESISPGVDARISKAGFSSLLVGSPLASKTGIAELRDKLKLVPKDSLLLLASMAAITLMITINAVATGAFWPVPLAGILFSIVTVISINHVNKSDRNPNQPSPSRPPL